MEQNNFEKHVQQKLDELKIPPSDSVWANVEKRIAKKDKDKKLIFILFFLILFLLSGGYWLLHSSKNTHRQRNKLSEVRKDSKSTNKDNFSFQKREQTYDRIVQTPDSTNVSEEKIKTAIVKLQNKDSVNNEKFAGSKPEFRETDDNEIVINREHIITTDSALIKKETGKDSSKNKIEPSIKKESKKSIEKKKDHWTLGITLTAGSSIISKSKMNRALFFVSNPSANNGGIPSYYYTPSEISNSIAFIAGIFAEKNITAKNKISIGISYRYFSLLNKVGNKIDSLYNGLPQAFSYLNNVYSSAVNLKTYRNNFHFIEVPVSIKFQINNNSNLPLFLNAGINISELVSSNALQFNSAAGLYYPDNSFLNKTQLGVSAGFAATLFVKGKRPFNLEPYFYYSATSLGNKGLYNKKHFTFIGLKSEILFGKK